MIKRGVIGATTVATDAMSVTVGNYTTRHTLLTTKDVANHLEATRDKLTENKREIELLQERIVEHEVSNRELETSIVAWETLLKTLVSGK